MRKSRSLLLVTLSATLGGCTSFPLLGNLGLGAPGAGLHQGAPLNPDFTSVKKVKIEGTVAVPTLVANNSQALNQNSLNPSSLIGNNANALVGNNANALIANNANALVGNNANALTAQAGFAPAFRVAAVESTAVEKMFVAAFNDKLAPVSALTLTDAAGKFSLEIPPGVVLIEAVRGQARQLGLAYSDAKQVSIDLSTTLVAAQMQATGKFASYSKADVDTLVAEVAKSASDGQADVLLKDDAALKNAFTAHTAAKTLLDKILSGNTGSSGSGTGTNTGNNAGNNTGNNTGGQGGTPTRTQSTIAVSTWPEFAPTAGNHVKKGQDDGGEQWLEVKRAETNASLAFVTHTSPNIKDGDIVAFELKVTSSSQPQEADKFPVYLKFLRSDGSTIEQIGLYHTAAPSGLTVPACNDAYNTSSCVSGGGVFVPFQITVSDDVAKLEFGGRAKAYTGQLSKIEVNP